MTLYGPSLEDLEMEMEVEVEAGRQLAVRGIVRTLKVQRA